MSTTGICSVIQITISKSASLLQNRISCEWRRNINYRYVSTCFFFSLTTVLYTGTPSTTCPPLPGVTLQQFVYHNQAFVLYGKGSRPCNTLYHYFSIFIYKYTHLSVPILSLRFFNKLNNF